MNKLLLVIWSLGNVLIFSAILFVKYNISGVSLDTFLVAIVMIFWVIGQMSLIKNSEWGKA